MKKYNPLKQYNEVSIWRRGFAFIIDIIIIEFLVGLSLNNFIENNIDSSKSLTETFNLMFQNYEALGPKLLIISIITAFAALVYFTLMEWRLKQTIGKMIFKIKVSSESKLKFSQSLIRNIPKACFFVNYLIWIFLIDLIYHAFTRRRLFDKLANTNVEKA